MKRVLSAVLVLFGSSVVAFLLIRLAPGDPALARLGLEADAASVAAVRRGFALDQPLVLQYAHWLSQIFSGDLGRSLQTGRPVLSMLFGALGPTILLSLTALVLSIAIAVPAGVMAASRHERFSDYAWSLAAVLALSVPSFWLGMLLVFAFAIYLPVLPASGYVSPSVDPFGFLRHLALPALTLGIAFAASSLRMTRAAMLDILGADFIRTARAKGLRRGVVLRRHALPNAIIPIVTVLGLQMGQSFGGVVVTETLFAWPGLGKLTVDAVFARDYPVVQGAVLATATLFLLINFLTDLLYVRLDARIGSVASGGAS